MKSPAQLALLYYIRLDGCNEDAYLIDNYKLQRERASINYLAVASFVHEKLQFYSFVKQKDRRKRLDFLYLIRKILKNPRYNNKGVALFVGNAFVLLCDNKDPAGQ